MDKLRWGILGTGNIAQKFAEALTLLPEAFIAAVGSRTQASAEQFGGCWNIPYRHGSYDDLALDDEVDVVYIATPHPLHKENTLACLRAGKHVLCEKPFAMNAREAGEMITLARAKKLFLMEAMWTRYFPAMRKVRSLLVEGALGDLRLVQADFGFRAPFVPSSRLYDPALGGGALMDLGVYPVSLASMVFGEQPRNIKSVALLGATGVDEQAAAILEYAEGRQAVMVVSFRFDSPQEAHIVGSEGRLRIHSPWWHPQTITWSRVKGEEETIHLPYMGNGYAHEAQEVMECMRAGRGESALMPLDESHGIMRTLDSIRAQWGLRYEADAA